MTILLAAAANEKDMRSLIDNAGPIAGLFVLLLLVSMFFLWRSMSRQMKKIDPALPKGRDELERERDLQMQQEAVERGEAEDGSEA